MPSSDDFDSPRPNRRRSWFHYAVGGALLLLGLVILAGIATLGVITWRVRTNYFAAQRSIEAEITRIQAAGEPFSAPEMYAFHRVAAGTPDATAAWLKAIATFEHEELEADINALPLFGEGTTAVLPAQLTPKDAAAVAGFLEKYASTIDAVSEATREPGECRLPIKFEDEFIGNRVPSLKIYWLVRLLGLKAQRQQAAGDTDGAIETLTTMLAACSTLKRQPHGLDHGRRLASMSNVLRYLYWLMHDVQLDEGQLATLQSKLDEADYDESLTIALLGNRAMWYPYFLKNAEAPGVVQITEGDKSSEEPGRPQDCELTLRFAARMIAASRQPFPQALQQARSIEDDFGRLSAGWSEFDRQFYFEAPSYVRDDLRTFTSQAVAIAKRETMRTAIACERYRLKMGAFPTRLDQLVSDYLPAVPQDPFSGQPLLIKSQDQDVVIYSVGEDMVDDEGSEATDIRTPVLARKSRRP